MTNVIPITPAVARLLSRPPGGGVRVEAVVGGAVCITWRNDDGEVDLYFDLEQATQLALELSDAIELAGEFLKEANR